jgi:hypothetical protein
MQTSGKCFSFSSSTNMQQCHYGAKQLAFITLLIEHFEESNALCPCRRLKQSGMNSTQRALLAKMIKYSAFCNNIFGDIG